MFTTVAIALTYVALLVAGVVVLHRRRPALALRLYLAATGLAFGYAIGLVFSREWLLAGLWTFNGAMCLVSVRSARRMRDRERDSFEQLLAEINRR